MSGNGKSDSRAASDEGEGKGRKRAPSLNISRNQLGVARVVVKMEFGLDKTDVVAVVASMIARGAEITPAGARIEIARELRDVVGRWGVNFASHIDSAEAAACRDKATTIVSFLIPELG
jgi:hypothetical protein